MTQAKSGDTVRIHYTGKLADGEVFDSSKGQEPLEFVLGSGQVIEGFDSGVMGMIVGESKTITIPCDKAYGPRNEELVFQAPRAEMPEGFEPAVGEQLLMQTHGGDHDHEHGEDCDHDHGPMPVTIAAVDGEFVTLDANHMLAGHDLTFELELVAIG